MEETKPILTKPIKATLIFAAYKNLDVPCSHVSPFCVKKKKLINSKSPDSLWDKNCSNCFCMFCFMVQLKSPLKRNLLKNCGEYIYKLNYLLQNICPLIPKAYWMLPTIQSKNYFNYLFYLLIVLMFHLKENQP